MGVTRRTLLGGMAGGAALGLLGCGASRGGATVDAVDAGATLLDRPPPPGAASPLRTRGVIVTPSDLSLDWPERAAAAGLTTVALHVHGAPSDTLVPFIQSAPGEAFLDDCARLGLEVEYEMHCMSELVPRRLFANAPELFRLDGDCRRNPDFNFCVHSKQALDVAANHAAALARVLRPTTGRYFLWGDDGGPWCECARCRPLSASDQALLLENRLVEALRVVDSRARLAHLAYGAEWAAPVEVRPVDGVFLEIAPFGRRYDIPLDTPSDPTQKLYLDGLAANLAVFGAAGAQVLEYWLDDSRASGWQMPQVRLPWDGDLFRADVATYRRLGFAHVTSFAVFLDASYVAMYGDPPIAEYGAGLAG